MPIDPSIPLRATEVQPLSLSGASDALFGPLMGLQKLRYLQAEQGAKMQELADKQQARKTLQDIANGGGDLNDPKTILSLAAADPQAASAVATFQTNQRAAAKETRELTNDERAKFGNLAAALLDEARTNPDSAKAHYAHIVASLPQTYPHIDLSGVPKEYDENFLWGVASEAIDPKTRAQMAETQASREQRAQEHADTLAMQQQTHADSLAMQRATLANTQAYQNESLALRRQEMGNEPTIEIADPNSPTGTRIVRRSDAIGQPGAPSSGLNVQTDPETGRVISITTGRGAGIGGAPQQQAAAQVKNDITNTAYRSAKALIGNLTTGLAGQALSALPPSQAAELRRQVAVLKSNATIESLNAMRRQSPTGGALGNVTEKEEAMLASAAGALDPNASAGQFSQALDNYQHTILRIVNGPEVGDKMWAEMQGAPAGGSSSGSPDANDPLGIRPMLK